MSKQWTADELTALARDYQPAAVLMAAAELELFDLLGGSDFTAAQAASRLRADLRATTILLDALASLQLLDKQDGRYRAPPAAARLLSASGPGSVLAMLQHQTNCMRRWAQLAAVVKTGQPPTRPPSIRGEQADYESFVEAMDNVSAPVAPTIIDELTLPPFKHLLDIGGASGTWTIAFLRRYPHATATIFDLPQVIPQARRRIADAGLSHRVDFVGGDFYTDALPSGADLAWISAIVHQNSRAQNRDLLAAVFKSLVPDGQVLIRDIVMDESRISPRGGALFAINMLVSTAQGGTFTLDELRGDLQQAGFSAVQLLRKDEAMHSVVHARKPMATP